LFWASARSACGINPSNKQSANATNLVRVHLIIIGFQSGKFTGVAGLSFRRSGQAGAQWFDGTHDGDAR
jgi:hypothetical protein